LLWMAAEARHEAIVSEPLRPVAELKGNHELVGHVAGCGARVLSSPLRPCGLKEQSDPFGPGNAQKCSKTSRIGAKFGGAGRFARLGRFDKAVQCMCAMVKLRVHADLGRDRQIRVGFGMC
jgi:hypothetical protein